MALQMPRIGFAQLRFQAMIRRALLLAAAGVVAGTVSCADEGLTMDYLYNGASPAGAGGAFYRPLQANPALRGTPGGAGTSGVMRGPELNLGGSSGTLPGSLPGSAGTAGEGGSSSDLDFGGPDAAGSSGSAGFGF